MLNTSQTFRIFISSPFADMKAERDALQSHVFPRLRKLCQQYGTRFQAIDLRWGVSEEAALDQQTIKICLSEIERCQKVTPRPNFIILLGDRYGWRPIPDEIPAHEYDEIVSRLDKQKRKRDKIKLAKWYGRKDENSIPAVHRLKPRKGKLENYNLWRRLEQELSKILEEATVDMHLPSDRRMKYESSATEQEIVKGALQVPDAEEHVFCFLRKIEGLPEDSSAEDFIDVDDKTNRINPWAQSKLKNLKTTLKNRLPETVHEYVANWTGNNKITTDHLPQFCDDVYKCLSEIIKKQLDFYKSTDSLDEEIRSHNNFGYERIKFFTGREKILNDIRQYVAIENISFTPATHKVEPLAIYGKSGSGKSSLMAAAVEQTRREHSEANVISRFIGRTSSSSNIHTMLESLCRQISRIYGKDEASIPPGYREIIDDFKVRLGYATAENPLIIFLDALDQLSDTNNARNLNWLPDELPPYVRLVVSTLPGECLTNLKSMLSSHTSILEVESMPKEEGEALLNLWLKDASRTLQNSQKVEILSKFSNNGLPLYLRLAFEEAKNWNSYSKNIHLNPDVEGIIRNLFKRLSNNANHGKILLSHSLGYLGTAKNGLTEDEILDILSADLEVMNDFKRRSPKSPSTNVLPVAIWSRLYFDLEPYMTWRSADGTSLLSFFHRLFGEVVASDYLNDSVKIRRYRALASYFGNQANAFEYDGKQLFNLRRLSELPYQQQNGRLWSELESVLCNLSFIEAKCSANMTYDLIADYNNNNSVAQASAIPSAIQEKLESFARFVRGHSHILLKHPSLTFQEAFNEPDSTMPAQVARGRSGGSSGSRLVINRINKPQMPSACIFTLTGHSKEVWSCDVSSDGKRIWIISASADGTIKVWNAMNGSEISTLKGHNKIVEVCSFSPNPAERHILSADRDGRMMVWDAVTGDQVVSSFFGDKDTEADCNFSSDGKYIVVASRDKTLSVYDSHSGTLLYKLKGYEYPIKACAFSPDGTRIVSGDTNNQIKLWDVRTKKVISVKESAHKSGEVWRCKFSPDGKWIASVSLDGTLKLWDAWTLKEIHSFPSHDKPIWTLDISPDGRLIASGSFDNTIKIWDVEQKMEVGTLQGHEDQIWGCAFFPDSKQLVSASWDSTLKIWDLSFILNNHQKSSKDRTMDTMNDVVSEIRQAASPNVELQYLGGSSPPYTAINPVKLQGPILCGAFSPDSRLIVSASWDGWLRRWQIVNGVELVALRVHQGYITALTFSWDGRLLLICDDRGQLKIFDTSTWEETTRVNAHSGQITACSFSQDGKHILSSSRDRTLKVWEYKNGGEINLDHILIKGEGIESIECCAYSYNNKWIAAGTASGKIRLWNAHTMKDEGSLQGHTASVLWCTFSPRDSRLLLSSSMDETLKLWDLNSFEEVKSFAGHTGAVQTGYFSPNGLNIVSSSWDRTLKVWDVFSTQLVSTLVGHAGEVQDGRFSPDGKMIISASMDGTLRLWDTRTGAQIALIVGPSDWVKSCSFSPNGQNILSYPHQGALRLSDAMTGTELLNLTGHNGDILSSVFSPDGTKLLSASSDKTLKIWDAVSGKLLATLDGHNGRVQSSVFSPDGTKIVSGSWDKTIKIWDASTYTDLDTLNGHTGWIQQVMFLPNGKYISSSSADQTVKIWDADSGSLNATFAHDTFIEQYSCSPHSDKIVCANGNKLQLWNLKNKSNPLPTLMGHKGKVLCCAFSPDGTKIVSGSSDNDLKIWDAHSGKEIVTLKGHEGSVLACTFSPDGDRLVSGSTDCLLKIWDVRNQRELGKYWAGLPIHSVSYNPSGKLIVAGDSAGLLHILQEMVI